MNNTTTMEDIDICEKIVGPDIHRVKGKSVRTKPKAVANDFIEITQELKDTHQIIDICANTINIQGSMFLVTISNLIKFITIQDIIDNSITILNR